MTYASLLRGNRLAAGLAVIVSAFLLFSLPPYFTGGTRVPSTFGLHYPLLVAHVMFGSVAMITAVAQIWPRLRSRGQCCTVGRGVCTSLRPSPRRHSRW
ncbi:hypothetical protein [Mycobacterium gallinarum]|uniref:hypothetical protein n=1 Tax=Mycobacterium gallinarum TaxID=39689 RepID=UPI0033071EAC